jgi:hypothetical protein
VDIFNFDIVNQEMIGGLVVVLYSFHYNMLDFSYTSPKTKNINLWPFYKKSYSIPGKISDSTGKIVINDILNPIEDGSILEINDTPPGNGHNSSYKVVFYNKKCFLLPFIELVFGAKKELDEKAYTLIPTVKRYEFNFSTIKDWSSIKDDSVLCKKNIIQILKKVKKTIGNNLIIDKQTLTIVNNFYL